MIPGVVDDEEDEGGGGAPESEDRSSATDAPAACCCCAQDWLGWAGKDCEYSCARASISAPGSIVRHSRSVSSLQDREHQVNALVHCEL